MDIGTPLLPIGTPRDQSYICPHCQKVFLSFRDPTGSNYTRPAIAQRLTVDNARLTCGSFQCWEQEVNEHSETRVAFFQKYRKPKEKPPVESKDGY